jgi:hypothetical protein
MYIFQMDCHGARPPKADIPLSVSLGIHLPSGLSDPSAVIISATSQYLKIKSHYYRIFGLAIPAMLGASGSNPTLGALV